MDLVNQNKFRNLLIIVLLVLNLLTVSIIWMQTSNRNDSPPEEQSKRRQESVNIMKKALDLNEGQAKQVDKIRTSQIDQSKKYNDRLDELKKQMVDELFKSNPDTAIAKVKAAEIGEMQSKMELLRFKHFKELLAVCTPEQKEKLKPVLVELFGRKPPREESPTRKQPSINRNNIDPRDKNMGEINRILDNERNRKPERDRQRAVGSDRPGPPSMEEKLNRLVERLNLNDEQVKSVRDIMSVSKQKNEQLRKRQNPDPNEIEIEKEKNRKEEEESIMRILNEIQKKEYSKIIANRRR